MQKIVPNLWYNANAQEAAQYYCSLIPGTSTRVEMTYPNEGLLDFQRPLAGKPLVVALDVGGTRLSLINAGPEITVNPSISLALYFHEKFLTDDQSPEQALRRVWDGLSDGGTVLMGLDSYPFSPLYGWVQDRYGISWQLFLADHTDPAQQLMPCLLFTGAAQNRGAEAIEYYQSLFESSSIEQKVYYPESAPPVDATSLLYGEFILEGQRFSAMDSGTTQGYTFSAGVSFEVQCRDQAEIDRLWLALSAYPEEEQCGWLRDRFGVSWQIVPAYMGELMQLPDAFSKLMEMKKIVIADFVPAE